jgi:hypothetical protein
MAAVQRVSGVLGVKLVGLNFTGAQAVANPILNALAARLEKGGVAPAQLLVINPAGIDISEQK